MSSLDTPPQICLLDSESSGLVVGFVLAGSDTNRAARSLLEFSKAHYSYPSLLQEHKEHFIFQTKDN